MEAVQFPRMPRRKVSDEIFLMLQEKIFLGELKPGEKLPPERDLSKQLGVTRVPLREALKRLQAMKLVEVRHGDGIYILDYERHASLEFITSVILSGLPINHYIVRSVLEFRMLLMPELFRLAAKNATPENIKRLEELNEQMRHVGENRDRITDLDFEFNYEIARASGNLFAQLLFNSMHPVYLKLSEQFFSALPGVEQVVRNNEAILKLIREHDGDTLARNTRFFLELSNDFMLSQMTADQSAVG